MLSRKLCTCVSNFFNQVFGWRWVSQGLETLSNLPWGEFIWYLWCLKSSQVALVVENPPANAGDVRDTGSILGSGRSPGGGYGNPVQCSCLENPMDRGAWRATVHGVAKSRTQLSDWTELKGHKRRLAQIRRYFSWIERQTHRDVPFFLKVIYEPKTLFQFGNWIHEFIFAHAHASGVSDSLWPHGP